MRLKRPTYLFVIILTTVTIVFWIAYEVYLILTTTPQSSVDPKILEPLNPSLDVETLDDLNNRIYFEKDQETNPVTATTITPIEDKLTPTPTENDEDQ